VARDLGVSRLDSTTVRRPSDDPKSLVAVATVATTTSAAAQQPSGPQHPRPSPPQHPPRPSAAPTVLSVRLLRLQPGAPRTGHVTVRSHVLPEVRGRYCVQADSVQQVWHAHAIPTARRRTGQVVGRETVAGATAGVRAAGRGQGFVQTRQNPLGPHKVQPGILHRYGNRFSSYLLVQYCCAIVIYL